MSASKGARLAGALALVAGAVPQPDYLKGASI
jgi:hypothetical protein